MNGYIYRLNKPVCASNLPLCAETLSKISWAAGARAFFERNIERSMESLGDDPQAQADYLRTARAAVSGYVQQAGLGSTNYFVPASKREAAAKLEADYPPVKVKAKARK